MEFTEYSALTDIQKFFYGQCVFITGVTGLVGKVVLEKLLRSCPGIGMIYLHMRPKKGFSPEQRLEKLFQLELFKELNKVFPSFRKIVQVVEGDTSMERLGISYEDYEEICRNVSIVIHSAANISFNCPLKKAVDCNVKPTKMVLDMCHEMPNIKAFVHVSSICVKQESDGSVLEKIPEAKLTADQLMDTLEWTDENSQKAITEQLIEKSPLHTYPITKALSEQLIDQKRGNLPVAILRSSFICSTWKEPFPGWIDSVQGISGLILAAGKGVLRAFHSVRNFKINIVPVDFVSNAIITSAWHVGVTRPSSIFIVNAVLNYEQTPLADKVLLPTFRKKAQEFALVNTYRYPSFVIHYNRYAYKLHSFIDEWIPAFFIDSLLYLLTGRPILLKVYSKISFMVDLFYRLTTIDWNPRRDNLIFLKNSQSEKDAEIFYIDGNNFDWFGYFESYLRGTRKFLAREDPSTIPYARKKGNIWYTVTTIIQAIVVFYFLYYIIYT